MEPSFLHFNLAAQRPLFIGAAMGARFGYAPRACGAQSVPAPPARRAYGPGGFFLPLPVQFHNFLGDRARAPPVQTKPHFVSSSALHFSQCCWCCSVPQFFHSFPPASPWSSAGAEGLERICAAVPRLCGRGCGACIMCTCRCPVQPLCMFCCVLYCIAL